MAWKIEFEPRVENDLNKLDRQAQKHILDYFEHRIAPLDDVRVYGKALRSQFSGLWRYRIGDYRAICRIEDEAVKVLVLRVGHRKNYHGG